MAKGVSSILRRPPHVDPQNGQTYRSYAMTRDGFTLLAMGFNGGKALKFKLRYIEQFNAMEAELRRRPTIDPVAVLNDPAAMRGLLLNYFEKALALEAKAAAMQPDVDALERIAKAERIALHHRCGEDAPGQAQGPVPVPSLARLDLPPLAHRPRRGLPVAPRRGRDGAQGHHRQSVGRLRGGHRAGARDAQEPCPSRENLPAGSRTRRLTSPATPASSHLHKELRLERIPHLIPVLARPARPPGRHDGDRHSRSAVHGHRHHHAGPRPLCRKAG